MRPLPDKERGGAGGAAGRGTERCEHSPPEKAISARRCAAELRSPPVPPRRPTEDTEGRSVPARCRPGGFLILITSEENPGPNPSRPPPSGRHRGGGSLSGLCRPGLCSPVSRFDRRGEKNRNPGIQAAPRFPAALEPLFHSSMSNVFPGDSGH